MENNYYNQTKKIDPLAIGFFGIQIIFAAILISILVINHKSDQIYSGDYERQPRITIHGLDSISPSLPSGDQENIGRELFMAVEKNSTSMNSTSIIANVRNDTIVVQNNLSGNNFDYLSLIIDLPELNQSYRLFHEYDSTAEKWTFNTEEFLIIACLNDYDEIIYKDFNCKDPYAPTIYNNIAIKYLDNLNLGNNSFSLSIDEEDTSTIYVTPAEDAPVETSQRYIEQTKTAIESIGIPSNIFKYKIIDTSNLTHDIYEN